MVRNPFNNRPGLKALLLIGGAFSLAAAYLAWNYRLVPDPVPLIPKDSPFSLTVIGRPEGFERLARITAAFLDDAVTPVVSPKTSYTIFAVPEPETGRLAWHSLVFEGFFTYEGIQNLKLVRRSESGFGYIDSRFLSYFGLEDRSDSKRLPLTLALSNEKVRLKIGRDYRGFLKASGSAGGSGRRLKALPDELETYLYDPSPFSGTMTLTRGLLSNGNAPFPELAALLGQIPGPLEIAVGRRSDSSATSTFIIHSRLPSKATEGSEQIALSIRQYLGTLDPDGLSVLLQDKTAAIELRNSSNKVISEEFELKNGRLSKFYSANERRQIAYFRENSGDAWIADSADTIRNAILTSIGSISLNDGGCLPGGGKAGLIFSRPAWLPSFTMVSFLLNNPETGLFTICGYF